jgi:hypothetical protein
VSTPSTVLAAPWGHWTAQRPAFACTHLDTAAAGRTSRDVQRAITDHLHREEHLTILPNPAHEPGRGF